jgi:hypothetical protein
MVSSRRPDSSINHRMLGGQVLHRVLAHVVADGASRASTSCSKCGHCGELANTEIARRLELSRQTVVTWRGRYLSAGLSTLGREGRLSERGCP